MSSASPLYERIVRWLLVFVLILAAVMVTGMAVDVWQDVLSCDEWEACSHD